MCCACGQSKVLSGNRPSWLLIFLCLFPFLSHEAAWRISVYEHLKSKFNADCQIEVDEVECQSEVVCSFIYLALTNHMVTGRLKWIFLTLPMTISGVISKGCFPDGREEPVSGEICWTDDVFHHRWDQHLSVSLIHHVQCARFKIVITKKHRRLGHPFPFQHRPFNSSRGNLLAAFYKITQYWIYAGAPVLRGWVVSLWPRNPRR